MGIVICGDCAELLNLPARRHGLQLGELCLSLVLAERICLLHYSLLLRGGSSMLDQKFRISNRFSTSRA